MLNMFFQIHSLSTNFSSKLDRKMQNPIPKRLKNERELDYSQLRLYAAVVKIMAPKLLLITGKKPEWSVHGAYGFNRVLGFK